MDWTRSPCVMQHTSALGFASACKDARTMSNPAGPCTKPFVRDCELCVGVGFLFACVKVKPPRSRTCRPAPCGRCGPPHPHRYGAQARSLAPFASGALIYIADHM
eukprot:scaffold104210_cov75-Phaeocystis_antarctica.AAC.1